MMHAEKSNCIDVESLFRQSNAILDGHFLLTSGLHSPVYWEKFRIFENPNYLQSACSIIAEHFADADIDAVAGPTTGGIILAFEVARQLGTRCIFAEKVGTSRAFVRNYSLAAGKKRILIVDDILTTGKSIREVIEAVNTRGDEIVGIAVLVDRSDRDLGLEYPVMSCLRSVTPTFDPSDCPLCGRGIPLVKPGSSDQKL